MVKCLYKNDLPKTGDSWETLRRNLGRNSLNDVWQLSFERFLIFPRPPFASEVFVFGWPLLLHISVSRIFFFFGMLVTS